MEIEDDQDKGSQASGQHHPANSVHPHHFQQRRLHGFVLATGTRVSGRRSRSAGAGTPRRGAEPGRRRTGLGKDRWEDRGWLRGCSRSPQPRAGVWKAPELLWKCGDAWTRRLRAVAPPAAPPRLSAAAASAPAGGRRCLLTGRATGVRAVMLMVVPPPPPLPLRWPLWLSDRPPPSSPKATSLRSNDLYISGLGFTKSNSQPRPRGGRLRRAGRRAGPERRGGACRSPRPYPGFGRVQLFPGECAPRSAGSQRPSVLGPAGRRLELVCQRFHDKTRRKNIRIKSPRCRHPLLPACEEGSGGIRVRHAKREGVRRFVLISKPWAR